MHFPLQEFIMKIELRLQECIPPFLEEARRMTDPGDRNNANAVLQVSTTANRAVYERIRRDSVMMCQALRELMKEEIEEERSAGRRDALLNAIRNLMDSMKLSSKQAMDALKIPLEEQESYASWLKGGGNMSGG